MSDITRTEAIEELQKSVNHWRRLVNEGIAVDDGIKTLKALEYALNVLKSEPIIIPEKATFGDAVEQVFGKDLRRIGTAPDFQSRSTFDIVDFPKGWYEAPYRRR